ncbi:MAG: hypothetical protein ACP5S8_07055 [Hydrogenobaculum sp.]
MRIKGSAKNTVFFILIGVFSLSPLIPYNISYAQESQRLKEEEVLDTATKLFKAMERKHLKKIWQLISKKSKKDIVELVYKTMLKNNVKTYTKEDIEKDFENGGPIAKAFWDGYLKNFDPKKVLDESRWEKVKFDDNKAKIKIKYKKGKLPFYLKMYKEDNDWKVGLVESFGL